MTEATRMSADNPKVLYLERVFDAPRERVFKAWTDPQQVMQWWGPHGFTTPFCTIDLRVGGVFHSCMRSPEGQDFWSKGVYQEIVKNERIVCTDFFSDEAGNRVAPEHYGMSPDWPLETLLTVTFEAIEGNKTKLTVQHTPLAPSKDRELAKAGWTETLERLSAYLAQP